VRAIDTRKLGAIYPITAHPIARMDGEREKGDLDDSSD
jgi:hypothetical protein